MWEVNRVIRCDSWEELKKTAKRYEQIGFNCEVRGWEDIRDNKLTLLDDWNTGEEEMDEQDQVKPDPGSDRRDSRQCRDS